MHQVYALFSGCAGRCPLANRLPSGGPAQAVGQEMQQLAKLRVALIRAYGLRGSRAAAPKPHVLPRRLRRNLCGAFALAVLASCHKLCSLAPQNAIRAGSMCWCVRQATRRCVPDGTMVGWALDRTTRMVMTSRVVAPARARTACGGTSIATSSARLRAGRMRDLVRTRLQRLLVPRPMRSPQTGPVRRTCNPRCASPSKTFLRVLRRRPVGWTRS